MGHGGHLARFDTLNDLRTLKEGDFQRPVAVQYVEGPIPRTAFTESIVASWLAMLQSPYRYTHSGIG